MEQISITIAGVNKYLGPDIFRVGGTFYLEKDPTNAYDEEAIKVNTTDSVLVGYVANSIYSVARGTRSAGRIYETIKEDQRIIIRYIIGNVVIADLVED